MQEEHLRWVPLAGHYGTASKVLKTLPRYFNHIKSVIMFVE